MITLLATIFPFLLKFLGEGTIGKIIDAKKDLAQSANQARKNELDAETKRYEFELQRRQAQRDLQLKEMEHPYMWWGKFILVLIVCCYWAARFGARLLGLDDFHIYVKELDASEETVSMMVLGYLFLGEKINQFIKSKS